VSSLIGRTNHCGCRTSSQRCTLFVFYEGISVPVCLAVLKTVKRRSEKDAAKREEEARRTKSGSGGEERVWICNPKGK